MAMPDPAARHFVFLQGMPSPFFSRIGRALAAAGARVSGIRLCAGDRLFWRGPNPVAYRGSLEDWPGFIADFFVRHGVTDLILLGEQRNYHKAAVAAARRHGVAVTVTDFGYLRPDWITLERDGMGGNSRFPRDPDEIRRLAAAVGTIDRAPCYADSAGRMAAGDLLYNFANLLGAWLHPRYRQSDKRPHPLVYFPAMGLRLLLNRFARRRTRRRVEAVLGAAPRFFLFPLQLEHDFQIVAYSPFRSLTEAIRTVLASFSRHADLGDRLLIKVHPWDPGLRDWRAVIDRLAWEYALAGRVDYLGGGDLDRMIAASRGMVTVNSTSGLRALQLGKPVATLGEAVYHLPGLTHQGRLDRFWTEPLPPDPALVESFVAALAGTIQIRGVFFSEPGLSAAVEAASARLLAGTVGRPQACA